MMKVLVACEESQAVTIAFREKGHEAYSCDIQQCSGGHLEWHILGDCIPLLNGNCTFTTQDGQLHTIDSKWDLIIAHPPCTYLSKVSAPSLFPKGKLNKDRWKKALNAKKFFLKILNSDCEHICVENPVPFKILGLPEKSCIIQPWEFGEPYTKKTFLWLKGLPVLMPTIICEKTVSYTKQFSSPKKRSKTFHLIAKAMAEQWGDIDA